MRKAHIGRCMLLALCLLALAACRADEGLLRPSDPPTPTPLPPESAIEQPSYVVQRGDVVRELEFTARVAAAQEARLFFRAGGYLSRLTVQRGDPVRAGDVLAELAIADLQRQLDAARMEWEQAQLESTRAISRTQLIVQERTLALEHARAVSPDPAVLRAQVALDNAQQALINAQHEYQESLDRSWDTPDQRQFYAAMVAQAQTALTVAQAEHTAAAQNRAYTLRQLELALAQAELDHAAATTGPDPRLALRVQQLEAQIAEQRIVAPFDGRVLALSVAPGNRVEAYAHVLIVGDPTTLELRADLTAAQVNELRVGQTVSLLPAGVGAQTFTGVIRQLPYGWGGDVEETDRAVRITPDPDAPALALDDLVRGTVILEQRVGVLWLPPAALQTFRGRTFVFVQEADGTQRRVDVTTGIESDARVEIVAGLEEGQVIILP